MLKKTVGMGGMVSPVLYPLALHARRAINWYTPNAIEGICGAFYRLGGRMRIDWDIVVKPFFDGTWNSG